MTNGIGLNTRQMAAGDIVRHFKGKLYVIEQFAQHTETGEALVVYRALYPPFKVYARPIEMFMGLVDTVKYPEARQVFRFEKIMSGGAI